MPEIRPAAHWRAAILIISFASAANADTTPPGAPGQTTSQDCIGMSGNTCLVEDGNFTIAVTPANDSGGSGIDAYQICRSNDTTGWGGCDVNLTLNGTTSIVVSGSHRPAPGDRRAYYFRARDNAGNWGPWNDEMYIKTATADATPPGKPGPTTSPDCVGNSGNTCLVNDANFTIEVTPASDNPGGSGIDAYQICRSNHTTGWGGCSVSLTLNGSTSIVVSGSHRPPPGQRRAYYFRARDNDGNWGPWNDEMYIQTVEPDSTPPGQPGATTSPDCVGTSGNTCLVNDSSFTIEVTAASDDPGGSGIDAYQICRSNNTTGWGGCDVNLTLNGSTSILVTGSHRPQPDQRRAYYFRARDNEGNWGPWNDELYIQTVPDTTPPSAPGATTSPNCDHWIGNTCFVEDASFTIRATPATDSGGSGVNATGYQICRSNDTTSWGGCNVNLTTNGGTSMLVTGNHRPAPGNRRAYYFRARDNAGNWGAWNDEMYIQTIVPDVDSTPPSVVPNFSATINGAAIDGLTVTSANPTIVLDWDHASDASGIAGYELVLDHVNGTGWVQNPFVDHPQQAYTMSTSGLVDSGQYRLQIRARDNADNWGDFVEAGTFTVDIPIDTTAPSLVSNLAATIEGQNIAGLDVSDPDPRIEISWNHATDASGIAQYRVVLQQIGAGNVMLEHTAYPDRNHILVASGLEVGKSYRVRVRAQDNAGNWGSFRSTGSFRMVHPIGSAVNPRHELLITALPVVEDPVRTNGCGAWSMCAMFTSLAGSQDPGLFAKRFFELWLVDQHVNGDVVPAMQHIQSKIINRWAKNPNGGLNLNASPFRLLAIVNRFDLVGSGDAGEARMVYGLINNTGLYEDFTLIFEYKMSTQVLSRADWYTQWHLLNLHPDKNSAEYRDQLQFLTDSFARTPVNGKITLGQIRSNDGLIFRTTLFWEWREFMQPSGGANIRQTTVKQTPKQEFGSSPILADWINQHESELLNQTHVISAPLTLAGSHNNASTFFPPGVNNPWARLNLSQATCAGCHVFDTHAVGVGAPFFHISPRAAGQEAEISEFFFNHELCADRLHEPSGEIDLCWDTYVQNELGRRVTNFQNVLRSIGFKKDTDLKSFKPLYEPSDEDLKYLNTGRVH